MLKTLRELIELLKPRKAQLYASMILSFIDGFLVVVPILVAFVFLGHMVPPAAVTPLTSDLVIRYTVIMIVCVALRIVLRYYTLRLRSGAGYLVMSEQRKRLGGELRNASMGYFNEETLGNLVSTVTSDTSFIEIDGMSVVETAVAGISSILTGLVMLFIFDWRAAVAAAVLLIPTWFAYRWLSGTMDRENINRQELIGEVTEHTMEFIKGLPVLKTYNMTDKQFYKTALAYKKLRKLSVKVEFSHLSPAAVFQFCFRIITTVIILIAGISAIFDQISYPYAFILMLGALGFFAGAEKMGIYSIFSKITQHSIDRINQIKDIPKMDDTEGQETSDHFDLAFRDVSFAYNSKPVLKNISFTVPEKTTTALVGLSGSGKTTIANLSARFWDVERGQVLVGGVDVKKLDYDKLLQNLSFVFQDVFLFDDTVSNNIRIGKPCASIEEVVAAAKTAGCHEFISKMEDGYDTVIGEAGARLSGGEKQRLSIARALIKAAPIVLLDEVTANVDVENEQKIQLALHELLKDRTVIMIAHKLSTIKHVDQILVIEDGQISQRGTHSELVKQDGLYKKLWHMQYQTSKWKI